VKGLVQTILSEPALSRLKSDARKEGVSIAAYLRRLVLASQGEDPSGVSKRISKLEARMAEIEKSGVRTALPVPVQQSPEEKRRFLDECVAISRKFTERDKPLGVSLHGETDGEQLHAVLTVGEERLKIVWRTPLWFQVTTWVRGLDGLAQESERAP
jgi:hypothetical protein